MLDRIAAGELSGKHHTALRGPDGELRYEECLTRRGFDGPYTILYHERRPHELLPASKAPLNRRALTPLASTPLARHHYRTVQLDGPSSSESSEPFGVPLLWNQDVVISRRNPTRSGELYYSNADGDELLFIHQGGGRLKSPFGELEFAAEDYVCIPRGVLHRFDLEVGTCQRWLSIECRRELGLLKQARNELGQLRMDAPYCHRDFKRPRFSGPADEGIRRLLIKRNDELHAFEVPHSPLDVVGYDGTVYPWAFPLRKFQPRVASVHLPPTWHGTFQAGGILICSFVPRPLDFGLDAIPCPYPHASVDVDEVIYYVSGNFSSRVGIEPGSITHHPAGLPHGPHPGAYESSLGQTRTDELAVMLDCYAPLTATEEARAIEDPDYDRSFCAGT